MIKEKDILIKCREIISKYLPENDGFFDDDISFQTIGLTSINFMSIILDAEELYEIEFPDSYLAYEKVNSINSLAKAVIEILNMQNEI